MGDGIKSWHVANNSSITDSGSNHAENNDVNSKVESANKMGFFKRFRVSHGKITTAAQYFDLTTLSTDKTGGCGDPIPTVGQFENFGNNAAFAARIDSPTLTDKGDNIDTRTEIVETPIWLRYEPFILHVMCRSLRAASVLMNLARPSFKNVGLTSWNAHSDDTDDEWIEENTDNISHHVRTNGKNRQCKGGGAKYLVAIWGDEGLDMPLSLPSSPTRGLYYHPDDVATKCNAEWLAQLVNERHVRNWNKIERFVEAVKSLDEGVHVDLYGMDIDDEHDEGSDQIRHNNGANNARLASGLPIPRSYDVIGDVAVLNSLPEGDDETLKQVGEWILGRNKAIKVRYSDRMTLLDCLLFAFLQPLLT